MNKITLIVACSLLSVPAFAATVGEKSGVNSALGISPTTQDFAQEVAISDQFEIQSSKLAAAKLTSADKAFAEQMITDHTKTSSELMGAAKAASIQLPTGLDSSHQKMLDNLSSASGDDFRKLYFDDQVSAHKDAVSLFKRYGNGGDNAKLKSWANATLPALEHHLEMAQDLDKNT